MALERIIQWLELLESRVNLALAYARGGGASANKVFTRAASSGPHEPNAGAAQITLVAMVIKATATGRFLVGFELPYTTGTSTDTIDTQVNVDASVGAPTFANASGTGAPANQGCAGGAGAVQLLTGTGAGIVVTSPVASTTLFLDSGAQEIDVNGSGMIQWHGVVYGVPVGDWAIIRLSVALSGGVLGLNDTTAYAIEQP